MKATRDEQTFTLASEGWSEVYPIEELPKWLAFYLGLREKHPRVAVFYDPMIAALESIMDKSVRQPA